MLLNHLIIQFNSQSGGIKRNVGKAFFIYFSAVSGLTNVSHQELSTDPLGISNAYALFVAAAQWTFAINETGVPAKCNSIPISLRLA